jgi:adenosylcobinamide kinase / adenosylcobinamide-phosphate guanylyltransferase
MTCESGDLPWGVGGALPRIMLTFVIGGARSGKSRFAQSLATAAARVAIIVTAREEDAEMSARIAAHRMHRPPGWLTVEAPLEIASAAACHASGHDVLVLDCLTLWLSNFCFEHRAETEECVRAAALSEVRRLIAASPPTHLVVVSNEVGYGLVPETPVGRFFRDLQGWVNQDVAAAAEWVYHVVAGIPVPIKRPEAK